MSAPTVLSFGFRMFRSSKRYRHPGLDALEVRATSYRDPMDLKRDLASTARSAYREARKLGLHRATARTYALGRLVEAWAAIGAVTVERPS